MNSSEARRIIEAELGKYRDWPYERLCAMVDEPKRKFEVVGASGARYQIDIYAFWDGKPHGDIRVCGCIDDGGWRAFIPLSTDFIKGPDGSISG